jgi:hypothetical protein
MLGSACSPSLEPIAVGPGCPEKPFRGPEQYANEPADRMLADFEPDGTEDLVKVAGRDGSWVRARDLTSQSVTIQPEKDCAAEGKWAGHFAASTPTGWGNNWTANFRSGSGPVAYDARAYGGVSFWAAFGGDNGPSFAVPFGIVTMDTAPNSPICGTNCSDDYMKGVPLTNDWQRYELRFQDLAQAGWGAVQTPMRRDQLVGFIIWTKQQCDIWIDDLRFEP